MTVSNQVNSWWSSIIHVSTSPAARSHWYITAENTIRLNDILKALPKQKTS